LKKTHKKMLRKCKLFLFEGSALGSFCSEDVFIVLTEVGLKPCINLAQIFSICSGHKNEFLKKHSVRAPGFMPADTSTLSSSIYLLS
jgi:hypothetical protein